MLWRVCNANAAYPLILSVMAMVAWNLPHAHAENHARHTAPLLHSPVDCNAIGGCFIQNYVDAARPGQPAQDYRCGSLTYEAHDGTDFRLHTHADIARNIPVLAATEGVVMGWRDGVPDSLTDTDRKRIKAQQIECGNGVLLQHADGWQTQYCHLKAGSIKVRKGQTVTSGTVLGFIGQSGLAEFPHLHFTVRHQQQPIDPFTGNPVPKKSDKTSRDPLEPDCMASLDKSLWSESARQQMGYVPTSIMSSGFAATAPDVEEVRKGKKRLKQLAEDANILIFWAEVSGIRKGDTAVMLITAPDGTVVASHEDTFDTNRAAQFRYIGLKRPPLGWPEGEYTGVYRLLRGKETVVVVREKVSR